MRDVVLQGKSYLWFPDELVIKHRWQTVGLIVAPEEENPDVLNYFRLFVSANSKDKVDKFVAYLEEKGKTDAAIQIVVRKLSEPPADFGVDSVDYPQYSKDDVKSWFEKAQSSEPDFLAQVGDINIGIDRVHLNTQMPCEIIYTIDPHTALIAANGKYTVQFSADAPYVSCDVKLGSVNMKLLELAYWQVWDPRDSRMVSVGVPQQTPRLQKNSTGIWQAEFIGQGPANEFTFTYSRLLL